MTVSKEWRIDIASSIERLGGRGVAEAYEKDVSNMMQKYVVYRYKESFSNSSSSCKSCCSGQEVRNSRGKCYGEEIDRRRKRSDLTVKVR